MKIGRIIILIVGVLLIISATSKLLKFKVAYTLMAGLGLVNYIYIVGAMELVCAVLLLIPQTIKLGSYLSTGFSEEL